MTDLIKCSNNTTIRFLKWKNQLIWIEEEMKKIIENLNHFNESFFEFSIFETDISFKVVSFETISSNLFYAFIAHDHHWA